jgi:CHAT domain-containing protein
VTGQTSVAAPEDLKCLSYLAKVIESPGGSSGHVPLDGIFNSAAQVERIILRLENALLRDGAAGSRTRGGIQELVRDFGEAVFDAVFRRADSIARLYEQSMAIANADGNVRGIRLKLGIEAADLSLLPWEYLYDRGRSEWVGLLHQSPVVRVVEGGGGRLVSPVLDGRLNILGMTSNPGSLTTFDPESERHRIDAAFARHQQAGTVNFLWVPGDSVEDLLEMIGKGNWHVFHFIGHGGLTSPIGRDTSEAPEEAPSEGSIVLGDGQGGARDVPASDLKHILQGGGSGALRLVVLHCSQNARVMAKGALVNFASALVRVGIPAVVAMQFPISDEAAIQFSEVFYEKLAAAWPVEAALTEARRRMWVKSRVEWGFPLLYRNSRTGPLFTTRGPGPVSAPTAAMPLGARTHATLQANFPSERQDRKHV